MPGDRLSRYRAKRDFERTGEPEGSAGRGGSSPLYVIQKHAASSLHYDLRLEIDGALASWAVPKGPSTDTLRRTRGGDKPQWLLVKRRDEAADARRNPVSTQPESVLSGRTVEDVAAGR
jgi:hypothetical protein